MVDCYFKQLDSRAIIPHYAHTGDSGMDVYPLEPFSLKPGDRKLIKLGFAISIPTGYEIQVRSRSGLALKKGVCVLNSPGTVDAAYRGELGVTLINTSSKVYFNDTSQAIAQLVVQKVVKVELKIVEELNKTERGTNGYGSTDKLAAS